MKLTFITALALLSLLMVSCSEKTKKMANEKEIQSIFPKGELGPAANFTGNAWALSLVANDTTLNTLVGNVYFEPGARSNWHLHPAGQILIITDGVGYHQIEGSPGKPSKREM